MTSSLLLLALIHSALWFNADGFGSWIIGGREAKPHSWPFMASIQLDGRHLCGGFLVRRRWVMTAAHCLVPRRSAAVRVVLGAHSLETREASQQIFGIRESIAHPHYELETVKNDIRMLKLKEVSEVTNTQYHLLVASSEQGRICLGTWVNPSKKALQKKAGANHLCFPLALKIPLLGSPELNRSVNFNQFVKRILLPRPGTDLRPGDTCCVIGWGDVSNFGTSHAKLMELNTTVLERGVCNTSWTGHIFDCMICAASTNKGLHGFCAGDSGGPLICGNRVQGIVSFNGKRCGNWRFPDVYARISKYINWVNEVIGIF